MFYRKVIDDGAGESPEVIRPAESKKKAERTASSVSNCVDNHIREKLCQFT